MRSIRWRDLAPDGEAFHLGRNRLGRVVELHGHDFAELCWVEDGRVRHLLPDRGETLSAGSLLTVRPEAVHAVGAAGRDGAIIVNVAFPAAILDHLRERYFADDPCFFPPGAPTAAVPLTPGQRAHLATWRDRLARLPRTRLHLERFLLDCFGLLAEAGEHLPPTTAMPPWLAAACAAMRQHEHFAEGVPAFVRLCGRSGEHACRELKRHAGITPSDLVREERLGWAAGRLALDDAPIVDVALDAGYGNLGHFYRQFRARYGTTPRRWRLRHRSAT